jgi:rhodanese-related sulfurtransferase
MTAEPPIETSCQAVHAKREAGDDFLLLDCRETDEYEVARIAGAWLLPMSEIESRVAELRAERGGEVGDWEITVHCHHGGRSLQVAQWLRRQGFHLAQSMAGGIDQWATEIDSSVPRY